MISTTSAASASSDFSRFFWPWRVRLGSCCWFIEEAYRTGAPVLLQACRAGQGRSNATNGLTSRESTNGQRARAKSAPSTGPHGPPSSRRPAASSLPPKPQRASNLHNINVLNWMQPRNSLWRFVCRRDLPARFENFIPAALVPARDRRADQNGGGISDQYVMVLTQREAGSSTTLTGQTSCGH